MKDISSSIEACANHYGEQADAMRSYLLDGQAAALRCLTGVRCDSLSRAR